MIKNNIKIKLKPKRIIMILLIISIVTIYVFYVATRFTSYSAYYPFSNRIFNLNFDEVESIILQNGHGVRYTHTNRDEIKDICEALNSSRYRYFIPIIPISSGGYTYIMKIVFYDGTDSGWMDFSEDGVVINNISYSFGAPAFKFLTDKIKI